MLREDAKDTVSVERFPLVVITCPPAITLETVDELRARFDRIVADGKPYVVLTDTAALRELPNAVVRRALGQWWRNFDATSGGLSLGSSTVVGRPLLRSVLTGVTWVHNPATPQHYAEDLDEAERWCRDMLASHGLQSREPRR